MEHAFAETFAAGYERVVIVGTGKAFSRKR